MFPYALSATTLHNTTECGIPKEDYMSLLRPFDADLPWFGIFLGNGVASIWYWSCDQVIVQRTLAAKNLTHARAGCLVAGLLKFLPLFLMVFPGEYTDEKHKHLISFFFLFFFRNDCTNTFSR